MSAISRCLACLFLGYIGCVKDVSAVSMALTWLHRCFSKEYTELQLAARKAISKLFGGKMVNCLYPEPSAIDMNQVDSLVQ
jgi:hypothetical protein